ncbi:4'-phosphopantetheinyl transferase family protein [Lysinibacillus sp. NPDC056185]|uniref:4'-phosphopantetheinyl transferase family protein n=1 Tax=Lysinibacillus sp. NPDC056185 TaxID=3345739 RepID=UPI0039EFABF1
MIIIKLALLSITDSHFDIYHSKLAAFISDDKQNKLQRFHFEDDYKRGLLADILARYLISTNFNIAPSDIEFDNNPYGKPYVKNLPNAFFNVSHSGNYVLCGISNMEIGVDIEKQNILDLNLAQHIFAPEEFQDLIALSDRNQLDYFYKLWTLKEAYIKYCGVGLSLPLHSFFFKINNDGIHLSVTNQLNSLYFLASRVEQQYSLACCSNEQIEANAIEQISLQTIISFFQQFDD